MNMSSITLPTELYIARYQQLIVSYHFLQWKLSFPGEGTAVPLMETTVPFKGNWRFLRGNQRLLHIILMLDLYGLTTYL